VLSVARDLDDTASNHTKQNPDSDRDAEGFEEAPAGTPGHTNAKGDVGVVKILLMQPFAALRVLRRWPRRSGILACAGQRCGLSVSLGVAFDNHLPTDERVIALVRRPRRLIKLGRRPRSSAGELDALR
jgi:hypothetical protein